jgi:hypothetical protein
MAYDSACNFGARNSYICPRKHAYSSKEPPESIGLQLHRTAKLPQWEESDVFSWSIKTTNSEASARQTKS